MVSSAEVFVVSDDEAGERLDKIVARRVEGVGRRGATTLFKSGSVTVDGRRAKKSDLARVGARVAVALDRDDAPRAEPSMALDVRLETPSVVVVHKPGGLPTVPGRTAATPSLVGGLLARYPEMAGVGYDPSEPGILHRLDTGTSGLLVSARTPEAFTALREGLASGRWKKRYLAVVEAAGLPQEGVIDEPLRADRRSSRVLLARPDDPRARAARTEWHRTEVRERWAVVEVRVDRAYRHQIRAHLASIGHPIAGDALYGGARVPSLEGRFALHASYVAWAGDECVGTFEVTSDAPADFFPE
jgi:23S rRNA pseudouridine1911/1915/1917 synthase